MQRFKKGRAYLFNGRSGAEIIAIAREPDNVNGQIFEIVRANKEGNRALERCANVGRYFFAQTYRISDYKPVEGASVSFARRKFFSSAETEVGEY